ncbi:hypothetical protein M2323_002793 [Rhodoblastus acidophilus]|uniref:hypothetical protein n=1 Tax=Rhodoblastus acidophilus TaxID=1074 RepID=UPI00222435C9|nr:hypothetical protein [Rhodoblastus acidophilus]MCW2284853.1 hypothetical protein [Rhodoblastus acidophilus]MCW2333857.1 hypothetical protein [Rhodoblastus acidophilus]
MRSILGRASPAEPIAPPPPKPELTSEECERFRALGFFCGALTRDDSLYAEASAGAAAFAHFAGLAQKRDELRAELRDIFAKACLDGAHIRHVRDLDAFINASLLADHELALELTHALRIVLARELRDGRFEFEMGTDRSIAIFRHLLSLVRRAPDVFATLASPEGASFCQRAIEHRLLDERLDHADHKAPHRPVTVSPSSAEIARKIGLHAPYTLEAVHAARRDFAARHHPDRAPAHKRQQATEALAVVNAALDEIAAKLAV